MRSATALSCALSIAAIVGLGDRSARAELPGFGSTTTEKIERNADTSPPDVHIHLVAGTRAPVELSLGLAISAPGSFRFGTTFGLLPGGYVSLINELIIALGGFDDATGELVTAALQDSFVWRIRAGWQPDPEVGFLVDVGYAIATLGGGLDSAATLAATSEFDLPPSGADQSVAISSTVHMLDIELGWTFDVGSGFFVTPTLGFAATISSSSSVTADWEVPAAAADDVRGFETDSAAFLDGIFESYVFTPTLAVVLEYRLL